MSASLPEFLARLPLGRGVTVLAHDANGLLALQKPEGVLSHPNEPADEPRSLLTARYTLDGEFFEWMPEGGAPARLWLLNRLDSATSGVILAAASEPLAAAVREHFARKQVRKVYNALVFGRPARASEVWRDLLAVKKQQGQIRTAARGNLPSETHFQALQHHQRSFSTTLVRLEPRTGRSHQLRVQCAKRELPIVGDQTYGDFGLNRAFAKTTGENRLFLHSLETAFTYEFSGGSHAFKASAPLPREFGVAY